MTFLGFALAIVVGLSLGMLGGGGSILTVPIFVYVLGFGAKQAIAMSLPVVGITSLVGAVGHWRAGNVRIRSGLVMGGFTMAGAFAGARLATLVSGQVQLFLLGAVMLVAAVAMYRRRAQVDLPGQRDGSTGKVLLLALAGLGVGILTGLVGIGGGFLILPALVLLARVPIKEAVGTSLVVIALNTAAGFAGYTDQVSIPWGFLAAFTALAILGILAGTRLVRHLSPDRLRRGFALFLVLVGLLIFVQNRGAVVP